MALEKLRVQYKRNKECLRKILWEKRVVGEALEKRLAELDAEGSHYNLDEVKREVKRKTLYAWAGTDKTKRMVIERENKDEG